MWHSPTCHISQLSTSLIIKKETLDILFKYKDVSLNLNKTITNMSFNNKNTTCKDSNLIVLKNTK